jgi:hypothetical protein
LKLSGRLAAPAQVDSGCSNAAQPARPTPPARSLTLFVRLLYSIAHTPAVTMTLAKGGLLTGAVVFVGVGLGFLLAPVQWASVTEIALPTAMARTDFRATYGGFDLAMGVFLAVCAFRTGWTRPGVAALALAAAGFGGGRLVGILVEGTASPLMLAFLGIETTCALLALYVLQRLPTVGSWAWAGAPN